MKANIPENKAVILNTPEQVKEAALEVVAQAEQGLEERKGTLVSVIEELEKITPEAGGMRQIAALLSLPEDQFSLLCPIFIKEIEKGFNNVNDQLSMVQALNAAGLKAEDVEQEYDILCSQIDTELSEFSGTKRDFLKQILGVAYNAVLAAEGIAKRRILIPIEYCRPDAKMPTYAHLTDAGMDVYLTEDIRIYPGETKLIPLGIKCAIPLGYELQVRPKSGRSLKSKLRIANTPGTIDAGYRDEICIIADNIDPVIRSAEIDENGRLYNVLWGSDITLEKGEKIAQLVLSEVPKAVFYEVENVSSIENDGRNGGFGSTGDK